MRFPAKTKTALVLSKFQGGKMADDRTGVGNIQDELEHLLVPESKDVFNK